MMQRNMHAFNIEHAQALRQIGFLGDADLEEQPLWKKLQPLQDDWPTVNFAFINGHDIY